jgi:hypothetical protein
MTSARWSAHKYLHRLQADMHRAQKIRGKAVADATFQSPVLRGLKEDGM